MSKADLAHLTRRSLFAPDDGKPARGLARLPSGPPKPEPYMPWDEPAQPIAIKPAITSKPLESQDNQPKRRGRPAKFQDEPWKALGISRRTWFARQAKAAAKP